MTLHSPLLYYSEWKIIITATTCIPFIYLLKYFQRFLSIYLHLVKLNGKILICGWNLTQIQCLLYLDKWKMKICISFFNCFIFSQILGNLHFHQRALRSTYPLLQIFLKPSLLSSILTFSFFNNLQDQLNILCLPRYRM